MSYFREGEKKEKGMKIVPGGLDVGSTGAAGGGATWTNGPVTRIHGGGMNRSMRKTSKMEHEEV